MQVHEGLVEEGGIAAELLQVGGDVAVGDLGGLLHDVAELAGQLEAPVLGVHEGRLDVERGAAQRRPGQSRDDADAREGLLLREYRLAEKTFDVAHPDLPLARSAVRLHLAHGDLAQDLAQAFLQVPHAGLAGVAFDDAPECRIRDADAARGHAGVAQDAWPEVVLRDPDLLFGDVAGQMDDLHPIQQRRRDGVELVGRADEEHPREIHAHVEIVVQEFAVLLGIERLEQGGGGIAQIGGPDLVDLVEHDHRVGHAGFLERLDEFARHGADVGAAMPLDLGFVAHAAQAEAIEATPQRPGDGAADGGLADTGRPDQQQDGAGDLAADAGERQEFDDALLDVLQPVVILVEHCPGVIEIEIVLGQPAPGHAGQPVQVVAGDRVFR